MLKMTSIKLELILDIDKNSFIEIDKYLFIEEELRGVISYICQRFSKPNNKYMSNYDPTKESKFKRYLDANNLCTLAMSQYLPYGKLRWLKNIDNFDIKSIEQNISKDNLEVDLEYSDELHELHNDYPLAPKKLANSL